MVESKYNWGLYVLIIFIGIFLTSFLLSSWSGFLNGLFNLDLNLADNSLFEIVSLWALICAIFIIPIVWFIDWIIQENTKSKKHTIPAWVWGIVVLALIYSIFTLNILSIFMIVINIAIGLKCKDWAEKINKNILIAFFIGFVFGIFGILGYYIYYKHNNPKEDNEKRESSKKQKTKNVKMQKKDTDDWIFMLKAVGVFIVIILVYLLIRLIF